MFEKKQQNQHHLVIIDGPPAVSISKLLVNNAKAKQLRFIASVHYLALLDEVSPTLKQNMVGWNFSTLLKAMFNYLISFFKHATGKTNKEALSTVLNRICIADYISKNVRQVRSVIVFNERNPPPAFAVTVAKKNAINTICIQHGAVVENYFPIQVDCYFTWSDYYCQLLQNRIPGLKTVSVGRLGYKTSSLTSITKHNKPLLVLQPANVSINEKDLLLHFETIIDVCFQFFDEITLRPHPSDNILNDIVDYIGDRSFSVDRDNIGNALSSHKFTISLYSTVLYEAPLYNSLPIQYLESHLSGELMSRGQLLASNSGQLFDILTDLQDKPNYQTSMECAKQYSEERMKIADIDGFFNTLAEQ